MRIKILFISLIISNLIVAQNNFIYLRYTPLNGNSTAIVNEIDNIIAKSQRFIVYISNSNSPITARRASEWSDIKTMILTQQNAYDFYEKEELIILNRLFSDLFNETVSENLTIKGDDDDNWTCTFILSEKMYDTKIDVESIPIDLVRINELDSRMNIKYLYYNEEDQLFGADNEINKHF